MGIVISIHCGRRTRDHKVKTLALYRQALDGRLGSRNFTLRTNGYLNILPFSDIRWTHWGLNPGPSACEADVIPLHHVPLS